MPVLVTLPVVVAVKSLASTPLTPWLKVTVYASELELLGEEPVAMIEETVGEGMASDGAANESHEAATISAVPASERARKRREDVMGASSVRA